METTSFERGRGQCNPREKRAGRAGSVAPRVNVDLAKERSQWVRPAANIAYRVYPHPSGALY